jgi:hypothetical protein
MYIQYSVLCGSGLATDIKFHDATFETITDHYGIILHVRCGKGYKYAAAYLAQFPRAGLHPL